jgi:hypothetical protein
LTPFIRQSPGRQFVLNGWKYREALKISTKYRLVYFGPKAGSGSLVKIAADECVIDLEKVVRRRKEFIERGLTDHAAYTKAIAEAEYELDQVRVRLNEVVSRWRANRAVNRQDRNIIPFPVAPRMIALAAE